MFVGLSVGSVFTIYSGINPSIFSIGGIFLAIGLLYLAKTYSKIMNMNYFFYISFIIEIIMLILILFFLIFKYNYTNVLFIYLGYQFTFVFGSYIIRAETLLFKKIKLLAFMDIAKQKGYLIGLFMSYIFYKAIQEVYQIQNHQEQILVLHYFLLVLQIVVLCFLTKSFIKFDTISNGFKTNIK
jgi:hypothetical protein